MANNWTKLNRNAWTWNEDSNFRIEIFKVEGERFYVVDIWWTNPKTGSDYQASLDGATYRSDVDTMARNFMNDENPRELFEKENKFNLLRFGYCETEEQQRELERKYRQR